jgi:hypothetical protein
MGRVILNDGTILQNCSAYLPPKDVQRAKELKLPRNDILREALRKAIEEREAAVASNPDKTRPQQHPQNATTYGGMVLVDNRE